MRWSINEKKRKRAKQIFNVKKHFSYASQSYLNLFVLLLLYTFLDTYFYNAHLLKDEKVKKKNKRKKAKEKKKKKYKKRD